MKVTVTKFLNVRVGAASVNAPCYQYLAPGSELDVDGSITKGDPYDDIDTWLKDTAGNYYWSGGVQLAVDFPNHTQAWYLSDFGIPDIWKKTKGEDVTIILIDSGINIEGLNLPGAIQTFTVLGDDAGDKVGHGTAMFSILKGYKDFLGVAPSVNVQSVKITDEFSLQTEELIKALKFLKTIVDPGKQYIVNCSLAIENCSDETKRTIQDLVSGISKGNNILFNAAVGNFFGESKTTPAGLNDMISVAGIKKENDSYKRILSNNYWPGISLVCPGKFDLSFLDPLFKNVPGDGSSHACAYATGIMALICSARLKQNKKTGRQEMINILKEISVTTTATNAYNYSDAVLNKEKLLTQIT